MKPMHSVSMTSIFDLCKSCKKALNNLYKGRFVKLNKLDVVNAPEGLNKIILRKE